MKVIIITATQAEGLKGKKYNHSTYFNPVKDADGNWCISEEEVKYIKDFQGKEVERKGEKIDLKSYEFLKTMQAVDYKSIAPKEIITGEGTKEIDPKDETIKDPIKGETEVKPK